MFFFATVLGVEECVGAFLTVSFSDLGIAKPLRSPSDSFRGVQLFISTCGESFDTVAQKMRRESVLRTFTKSQSVTLSNRASNYTA